MTAAARQGAAALPVRPGEKPWTGQELAEVRKELEAEAAGLREDISTAESEIAARLGDAVGDAGDDSADAGAKTFQREHELALTQNARELLTQIERALARIEDGTLRRVRIVWRADREGAAAGVSPCGTVRDLQAAGGTALNGSAAPGGPDRPAGASLDSLDDGQRPRRVRLLFLVAVLVFVTDLVSKTIVVATLSDRPPLRLLGGLLRLAERATPAPRSASGHQCGLTVVFSLIAVGVIIAILRTSRRLRSLPWAVTLGLLLGGATGNLGDRIFRSPGPFRGYVVDWIQLPHWPVFNVADSCIVCGGILAVLLAARGVPLEGTRPVAGSPPDSDAPAGGQPGGTPVRDRSGQHPAGDGGR